MNEQEQLAKRRTFYLRLLVIGLFAFALLHSINPFFFRFFFWISFGVGAMALYYHIALKIAVRGTAQFRPEGQRAGWSSPHEPNVSPGKSPVKKAIGILIAIVFLVFFLLVLIGIFVGDDESSDGSVTDVVSYNEAQARYDNQDYRGAIKILWNPVTHDTPNTPSVMLMANAYYELQQLDSAYVWFAEVYGRGERSAYLSHVMGYILDEKGNTSDAILFYKEAVEMDSTKADVLGRLAELDPDNAAYYKKRQQQVQKTN